ncbi:MAG TPA: tannase/feruloyl esterase family alpha/beta hydrolase [Xanthobacteraceae bacterium]
MRAGIAALAWLACAHASAASSICEDLGKFPLAGGHITSAVRVGANDSIPVKLLNTSMPAPAAFCRIAATLTPTEDSTILAELWLPEAEKWNGKFLGVGNGGFGGAVPMVEMRSAVAKGYATAGDDLGHQLNSLIVDGAWVIGHPEKLKDFAYRADHVTADFAKTLIAAYYGRPQQLSYFRGCSNGGHEALMEAQKYPADYDGIVAGAPANSFTRVSAGFLWNELALNETPQSQITQSKLAAIQKAALAKCDALDGVKDGIINDPASCHFDPSVLLCKTADGPECLTKPQLAALRKIYSGPIDPKTRKPIYPGFPAGDEALPHNWDLWIIGPQSFQALFANQVFGSFLLNDAHWDFRTVDFARDSMRADKEIGPLLNSNDPNLSAFAARGGKLILFQGWADAAITPFGTIQYYRDIQQKMGTREARRFVRLFMAPGMMHCSGGPGPNTFDAVAAVDQWRQKDEAPDSIPAAKYADSAAALAGAPPGEPLVTRPLCAYPRVAHWTGTGSSDKAENYVCR